MQRLTSTRCVIKAFQNNHFLKILIKFHAFQTIHTNLIHTNLIEVDGSTLNTTLS